MQRNVSIITKFALLGLVTASLSACNTISRLSDIGGGPRLSEITNPTVMPRYRPVSLPMPKPKIRRKNPNSLWRSGATSFFKDQRAKAVGDIVTVNLSLNDSAKLANKTERSRNDREKADVTALLGFETKFAKHNLPSSFNPAMAANFGNTHSTSGDGSINRSEKINITFAAIVTQVLPNGSLVIVGRQEILVNSELRALMVTGIIRPGDISADDSISNDRIAEMRVSYGGRGSLSNLQQPRWGTQLWDTLFPF